MTDPTTTSGLADVWNTLTPFLTPLTVAGVAWKARGFLDKLVNNHLAHAKAEIIEAVKSGVEKEDEGHKDIAQAVRESSDRIVNTMITLQK